MNDMGSILTLTLNPAVDLSTAVDTVVPERKLRCDEAVREPGGGGINVARAIRNLGGHATALVATGGRTGERLVDLLREEQIPLVTVDAGGETRESVNVFERSSTQQYRFIMPGPALDRQMTARVIETMRELDPFPQWVVASGSLPSGGDVEVYRRVADLCVERNSKLIVDTSGDALRATLGPGVFLIKPNVNEFRTLIGEPDAGDEQLEAEARRIIDDGGTRAVLISLGSGGALLVAEGECRRIPAPTVRIESKVGAGDSMVAGVVLALSRGASVEEAATRGVASGAAAVMTPGTELCRGEDAEQLFRGLAAAVYR